MIASEIGGCHTKRTTLARGEEARAVVYQPRGVGLMHTRPKPSEANYTHGEASWRKSLAARKTTFFL